MDMFHIKADYDLNIMKDRQTLAGITTLALGGIYETVAECEPDVVLVHGDTTTTLAGSLASFYNQVKVGHVEAGLRTYDKYSPFPEEMNRKLTGAIADFHFSPTIKNRENLARESITNGVYVTGNTVIDAIQYTAKADYTFRNDLLNTIDFAGSKIILVTAHRRENLGKPLEEICSALRRIVEDNPDTQIVYPVHLNPAVRDTAFQILGGHDRIHLIDPLDVDELHNLMSRCYMVMTDSGGLQEEAPSLGKPVLVLRTETERPEAVEAGTVKLAGVEQETIYQMANELLRDAAAYQKMSKAVNPYGDGQASRRIVEALLYEFGMRSTRPDELL